MVMAASGKAVSPNNRARYADGTTIYTQSYSTPLETLRAEFAAVRNRFNALADGLALRASNFLQRPLPDIVVRDILPSTDLGLSNEIWITGTLTANTFVSYISNALGAATKVVGFIGFANLSSNPQIAAIKFLSGSAQTIQEVQTEQTYAFPNNGWSLIQPPVIYQPNETVSVQVYSSTTTAEHLVLLGLTAEQTGIVVSPFLGQPAIAAISG